MTDSNNSKTDSTTASSTGKPVPVASLAPTASNSGQNHTAALGSKSSRSNKASANGNGKSKLPAILDNRWFVLGAIFGAMMFLGLPLLWRCPAFSWIEKILWTIVTTVYSYAIIWAFLWVMSWSWRQIQNSL